MRLLAIFILMALAAPAAGQGLPVHQGVWGVAAQQPHPAVVRVVAPEAEGTNSLGSGTLVAVSDQQALIITNWHVVKDSNQNVVVLFADGFRSEGRVLKVDADWDLAAVAIWKPNAQPVPLAEQIPQPGDLLTIAGYGAGPYRAVSGRCQQYLSPGPNLPYDIIELSAAARNGDSGGPILNQRGEMAGVLFGQGGGLTSGSHCGRVRWFLSSLMNDTPSETPPTSPPPVQPFPQIAVAPERLPPTETTHFAPSGGWQPSGMSPPIASGEHFAHASTAPAPSAVSSTPAQVTSPYEVPQYAASAEPFDLRNGSGSLPREISLAPLDEEGGSFEAVTEAGSLSASPAGSSAWQDVLGHHPLEQLKTVLAAVGLLSILAAVARQVRGA